MPAFIPSLPLKIHSASPRTSTHKSRSLLQASHQPINNTPCKSAPPSPSRRKALQYLAATLITTPALLQHSAALAASSQKASVKLGPIEESDAYGYSFATPPEGWSRSTASLSSFRVATVFLNEADGDSNINMVVTPVAGDFQKLTSFGTLENVLQTIVPKRGKDIEGDLISTRTDTEKNAYVIEYTITSKGVKRHLLTVFSLQPGRYLLTLTGQALEDNWASSEPVLRAVTESYKLRILN